MSDLTSRLREIEERTDKALGSLEHAARGGWAEALEVYRAAGAEVDALGIPKDDPAYKDARRIRAYLYFREANALRALGRPAEAGPLGDLELDAALASGDSITIARSMFSLGGTCLANGEIERGLKFLDDSKAIFEYKDDLEHRQGLVASHPGRHQQRRPRPRRAGVRAEDGGQGAGDFAPAGELAGRRACARRPRQSLRAVRG